MDTNPSTIKINNTNELKVLVKGGGIGLIGNITLRVLTVFFQIIIARQLGSALMGVYGLGFTITTLVVILVVFGLNRGAVKFIAHYNGLGDHARAAGSLHGAIRVLMVTSLIITPIVFLSVDYLSQEIFHEPELGSVLRILVISIPILALFQLFVGVMQAYKRIDYKFAIEQLAVPILKIAGVIIAIYILASGLIGVAWSILVASLVGLLLSAIVVWQLYPLRGLQAGKPIINIKELLKFSWPLSMTSFFDRVNVEAEIIILGLLMTSQEVGIYYVGFRATVLIAIFLMAFNVIYAPTIAELHAKNDREQLASTYKTVTRWVVTLAIPFFGILFLLNRDVMAIFGQEFIAGGRVIQILAISQLIFIATGPSGWMLTMTGHPRINLINTFLALIITIGLSFLLIPRYGAIGAAIAGTATIGIINLLRLGEVRFILGLQPYDKKFIKPILAGFVTIMFTYLASYLLQDAISIWRLVLLSGFLVGIYLLILFGLRLEDDDLSIIKAMKKNLIHLQSSFMIYIKRSFN
jgi:O-antigen/teichoic acid export membrane protein